MTRPLRLLVALVLAAGCSGGTSEPEPSRGGLIGTVDRAKVLAVCADVQVADQALVIGGEAEVDVALGKAADLLEQPPLAADGTALAGTLRQDLAAGDRQGALQAGKAWCAAH